MSLAPFVHILGRGPSKSRNLTRAEAAEAFGLVLDGVAEPEAVGALTMLMRYRGETATEIAGFVDAMRHRMPRWSGLPVCLDWPSYAAGRSRGHPWFLLAGKLVAQAGYPVLLHGWNSHQNSCASVRAALPGLGIEICPTAPEAMVALGRDGIAYVPVEALHPELLRLLKLRDVLGLRSPVNTALRALNPAGAPASVQGVFHPSYRELQQDSALLLEQPRLSVIKGGGGEFERNPAKDIALFGLDNGRTTEATIAATQTGARRLSEAGARTVQVADLWSGAVADGFAQAIVIGTAALALATMDSSLTPHAAQQRAETLWQHRHDRQAA